MGISEIKDILLVASGKGGVGKSTVATNLAMAFAKLGKRTGLLDADIYGPSLPTMMGEVTAPAATGERHIVPPEKFGLKLMSMGYLVDPSVAMVWRGPMLAGAATQLLQDVDWGALDVLVIDLPPGTGDIQLTLAQKFKVSGAVLVTTPQQVAVADVVRAKTMFDKVHIKSFGIVENMSYFVSPSDQKHYPIFGSGGGERAARDLEVPLLGTVPIEPEVCVCGDAGEPIVSKHPDSHSAKAFLAIARELARLLDEENAARAAKEGRRRVLPILQP